MGIEFQDPGVRAFLAEGEALYPADAVNFTVVEQRAFYDKYCAHFRNARPASVTSADFSIGNVSCRGYQTKPTDTKLLYLHGGGFILGGLESHDDVCAELCALTNLETIAVAYRLAPEHPFPAAFNDCWDVFRNLNTNVVISGDSAGGNLAAAICLKARDEGLTNITGQVLIYPGLGGDMSKGSYITQARAPGLTTSDVKYYNDTYGGHGNKLANPLLETNYLNLPSAFIVAAALDPLHDDAADYAERLNAAGVAAELRSEPHLIHSFLRARHMSKPAAESFTAIADAIRRFGGSSSLSLPLL